LIILIWENMQVIKLFIMQLYPTCCHFTSFRSKYSPQHPVLKHPQFVTSPNVRDQISHPCRTTGKIIVWNILIFAFLDSR
jgi:hypothetical protein